jgi:hypothetical protein
MLRNRRDVFADCAAAMGWGGLFDETWIGDESAGIFAGHRSVADAYLRAVRRKAPSSTLDVAFEFADATSFNAIAFEREGYQFIGVPCGTLLLLYHVFGRMLATHRILRDIGSPDAQPRYEPAPALVFDSDDIADSPDRPSTSGPTDPMRVAYAVFLVRIAFDFLIMHEYQHIEGGHLRLPDGVDRAAILEVDSISRSDTDALTRQVLEMDADAAATRASFKITWLTGNDPWRFDPILTDLLREPERRLSAWAFATSVLFRLMDEAGGRPYALRHASHPPPLMRQYFTLAQVTYILGGEVEPERVHELYFAAMDEADLGLRAMVRRGPTGPGFAQAVTPEFEQHLIQLVRWWPRVRDRLGPIAAQWGGSNAPDEYFGDVLR